MQKNPIYPTAARSFSPPGSVESTAWAGASLIVASAASLTAGSVGAAGAFSAGAAAGAGVASVSAMVFIGVFLYLRQ